MQAEETDDGKRPRNQAVDISVRDQLGCAPLHLHTGNQREVLKVH